jgi:alkylation response protein AidB-like acyl-CoA dehydrogenase
VSGHGSLLPIPDDPRFPALVAMWPDSYTVWAWPRSMWLRDFETALRGFYPAASSRDLSLSDASMAKLASTEATQRAVARATQVVGVESFRSGHIVEQLAQDVRALELFAGRTEALREAVAADILPRA